MTCRRGCGEGFGEGSGEWSERVTNQDAAMISPETVAPSRAEPGGHRWRQRSIPLDGTATPRQASVHNPVRNPPISRSEPNGLEEWISLWGLSCTNSGSFLDPTGNDLAFR